MPFSLEELPYNTAALEPHITKDQLECHYEKHHRSYVDKLNVMVPNTKWEKSSLEEIIKGADGPIFNCAAQTWNHTFYWNSIKPQGGGLPHGTVATKIVESFGSFEGFKKQFSDAAAGHFGSGWAWVVLGADHKLKILETHDAGNPIRVGDVHPLLTCDVWEHAYYIDYRNRRADYIKGWWDLVNWDFANKNLRSHLE